MKKHHLLLLVLIIGLTNMVAAQSSVIPNGYAATEGSSSTSYPWNTSNIRIQYCYDTTNFVGHTAPIIINELHWRANGGTGTWTGGTHASVNIEMSSSPLDQAAQTTTFATNHGLDRAKVFSGSVTVLPNSSTTSPRTGYYVKVKLNTPFLYDPTAGKDLLIDITTLAKTGSTYAMDCATTGCLTNRMYSFTPTSPTGTLQANVGPVIRMVWTPAKGLYAGFDATPKVGPGPLSVQFTDKTYTSDPGGVKTWAWDFNGDTKIDSTIQNPKFLYPTIMKTATYDVTLTVTDATHPSSSITKKAFITVDPPPVAGFTAAPTTGAAPLTVQFTDTSKAAASWAWDFNNDTVIDATVQNPKYIYGAPGIYTVKLSVKNNGGSDSITKSNLILALKPGEVLQTLPKGFLTVEGGTNNSIPFNWGTNYPCRHQICYDNSHFGTTNPVVIKQLAFRADCGSGTSTWTGGTFANATVKLSTCANTYSTMAMNFTANEGADVKTVYNGTVTVKPGAQVTPGPAKDWYITITLATPFVYHPTKGDLLFDINLPAALAGGTSFRSDRDTSATSMAYRVYQYGTMTTPSGSVGGLVMKVLWEKAIGLFPSFKADKTIGAGPLTVKFTDQTYTSDPGGVKTWAWDFDGDMKVDSTLQNPTHIYPSIAKTATYDVTLTVTDATHPTQSLTRKAYITVDPPPVADFSVKPTMGATPMMVTFTDLSVGATGWKWDFDNNTVVDSTLQNPKFVYAKAGTYSVALEVTGVGGTDKITKANLITVLGVTSNTLSADILQYQFNEVRTNKAFNSAATTVVPPMGTVSTATWQNDPGRPLYMGNETGAGCLGSGGKVNSGWKVKVKGSITIEWWHRMGTTAPGTSLAYFFGNGTFRCFTGGVANNTLWFRGTALGDVKAVKNVQTGMAGTWLHCALVVDDTAGKATWFFDGIPETASAISFTPNTFAYDGSTVTNNFFVGTSGTSTAATGWYNMDDFRFYSGARTATQIKADMLHEVATAGSYDKGCGGATIGANSAPVLGGTAPVFAPGISGPASKPGLLVVGTAAKSFMTIALPWDLGFMGFTGCSMHCDLVLNVPFSTDAGGAASINLPIPPIAVLEGAHLYAQGYMIGTGMVNTPGLDINIQK